MVKSKNRRLGVATGLGPSDRDVLLARLDRIEEVQERMLAMLTAESRKEQKTAPLPRPSSVAYDRLLRLPEVTSICGVSRSTIYLRIAQRLFPSPVSTRNTCNCSRCSTRSTPLRISPSSFAYRLLLLLESPTR